MKKEIIKEPTFYDAQKLSSFYATIESKTVLYKQLSYILNSDYIKTLSNFNIHEIYNHILLKYYPNETSIKSSFINSVLLNGKNHVTIFELPIISSRADLCKINGESIVYEIKTDLDNFSRLSKQISDYQKIFDKIYVICPKMKINQIKEYLPEEAGIYSYKITNNGRYIYKIEQSALLNNNNLNSIEQLKILRKSELNTLINNSQSMTRDEMINYLVNNNSLDEINNIFKKSLKFRYMNQWSFFKDYHDNLLEIDYQWFYKNTVNPELIYG